MENFWKTLVLLLVVIYHQGCNGLSANDFYNECGRERGCFGVPENCLETQDCNMAVSFKGLSQDAYEFQLMANNVEDSNAYVAVGLSEDQYMRDDSTVACSVIQDNPSVPSVAMYWNGFYSSTILDNPNLGLTDATAKTEGSTLICGFTRNANLTIQEPDNDSEFVFDLNSQEFYLLLARGTRKEEDDLISYHDNRAVSDDSYDFTKYLPEQPLDFYRGCGEEKGCFGHPEGCIDSEDCSMAVSYVKISQDFFAFELFAKDMIPHGYVAVGLSEDDEMEDDSVMVCSNEAVSNVAMYWNGYYESTILDDPSLGLLNPQVHYKDSELFCSFERKANLTFFTPGEDSKEVSFDLDSEEYFLLLARGSLTDDGFTQYHDDRTASETSFDLSEFEDDTDPDNDDKIYEGCNKDKGCFGYPDECLGYKNCTLFVSYKGSTNSKNSYLFEVMGTSVAEDGYAAFGLSSDTDMGDDSVIACANMADHPDIPDVALYWNVPDAHSSVITSDPGKGLSFSSVSLIDGVLKCSFVREADLTFATPGEDSKNVTYNIDTTPYHILLASGGRREDTGTIGYHLDMRTASENLIDLAEYGNNDNNVDFYEGCGDSKGCFGYPDDDCLSKKSCLMAASYRGLSEDVYAIEIFSSVQDGYAAFGLSQDDSMGEDSVVVCANLEGQLNDTSGVPSIARYWNHRQDGHLTSTILEDPEMDLSNPRVSTREGHVLCSFQQPSSVVINYKDNNGNRNYTFDANAQAFYLMLAHGPLDEDNLVTRHTNRTVSSNNVKLSDFNPSLDINIYNGCGTSKACIGDEDGCIKGKNCTLVTTYTGASATSYEIEVFGNLEGTDSRYVAMGLSKDDEMGDDSVMACIYNETNGATSVSMYWNSPRPHLDSTPLDNPTLGLSGISGRFKDDTLYCKFTREAELDLDDHHKKDDRDHFDLNEDPYFILMARGPIDEDYHIRKHNTRFASEKAYNFGDQNSYLNNVYNGCGKSKGCFGSPAGCVKSQSCRMIGTYAATESGDVTFSISAPGLTDESYVALALSEDEKMAESSVMFCYSNTNAQGVAMSFNLATARRSPILDDPHAGLMKSQPMNATMKDGVLSCTFTRIKSMALHIPGTDNDTMEFDLSKEYYLLLAKGPLQRTKESSGDLDFELRNHGSNFAVSQDKVNLNEFNIVGGQESNLIVVNQLSLDNCQLVITHYFLDSWVHYGPGLVFIRLRGNADGQICEEMLAEQAILGQGSLVPDSSRMHDNHLGLDHCRCCGHFYRERHRSPRL